MATSAPKPATRNTGREEPVVEEPKPKKSRKKLILILVITLLLLGGIGGGVWYLMDDDEEESAGNTSTASNTTAAAKSTEKKSKPEKVTPPVFVPLEPFTVNLQPEGGEHFLQVGMTLQVSAKEDVDQIKLYMPQIRSLILLLLSSKKASEISTVEGKKKLSMDIIAQINQPLTPQGPSQTVTNVFFTSFVIQ